MNYEGRGSFDEEDETEPNVNGFFSDLKTSVNLNFKITFLFTGCMFSKSSSQSKTFNWKRTL